MPAGVALMHPGALIDATKIVPPPQPFCVKETLPLQDIGGVQVHAVQSRPSVYESFRTYFVE